MADLSIRGLTVGVPGRTLLSGLDLSLDSGGAVGLVGRSGLGKTTLLRTIAVLIDPIAGELRLGGQTPAEIGYPTWRRRVCFVPQRAAFHGGTVEEELARPGSFATASGTMPGGQVRSLLGQLGLDESILSQPARKLSEGERQRVAFVRALSCEPAVLLLDEPVSALDPGRQRALFSCLSSALRDRGLSVLLVTHQVEQIGQLGGRVLNLEDWAPAQAAAAVSSAGGDDG